jgi:hypothetical protein
VTADEEKRAISGPQEKSLRNDQYTGEVAEKIELARKNQQNAREYCREYQEPLYLM